MNICKKYINLDDVILTRFAVNLEKRCRNCEVLGKIKNISQIVHFECRILTQTGAIPRLQTYRALVFLS